MRFFTASDGARLAYRIRGEGPALLCLSGLTRTMADFDYLAPHLEEARMICLDSRGRGASQWTGAETYTVPREARDALELLDHLGIGAAPILGTSRGGLIGMLIAATAPERLTGLCLNDVGPVVERAGLERIADYVGRNPRARTLEQAAAAMPQVMEGFANVPANRWREEAAKHYVQTAEGLEITYDPALRDAFLAAYDAEAPDMWPCFDALAGKPVALIRGANSDLLSPETAAEMRRRRPDMIFAEVPGRAHIPFLDEVESLAAIRAFLERLP
nr:alpha/beta hydrolase [Actibacterium sp. MT2.3-13A]